MPKKTKQQEIEELKSELQLEVRMYLSEDGWKRQL